jgi:hypothetical protein
MDSDNISLPENDGDSFLRRNSKYIGIIILLVIIISALFVALQAKGDDIDPEFARKNAFYPEKSLQSWYVMYLSETNLYFEEVTQKLSDTEYVITEDTTGTTYTLTFFEEADEESGDSQWYVMFDGEEASAEPILIYFDVKDYVGTESFKLIQETVAYPYLETVYLLFGAWEEAGVENQQLAYGMSTIAEAVGKRVGDTDKIVIDEISDDYFVDIYKGEIGTPSNPVIYLMTEPYGALKNNIVFPNDGVIVIEVPDYQQLRLFSLVVGELIAPSGGPE